MKKVMAVAAAFSAQVFCLSLAQAFSMDETANLILKGSDAVCNNTTCSESKIVTSMCGLTMGEKFSSSSCAKGARKKQKLNEEGTGYVQKNGEIETLSAHLTRKIETATGSSFSTDSAMIKGFCQVVKTPAGSVLGEAQLPIGAACTAAHF